MYRMGKHDIIGRVEREPKDYDLINVIILRINDQTKPNDEVLGLLQVLCSNLIKKEEKLKLMSKYGIRVKDVEEGVNRMCNLSELIEARGEARGESRTKVKMALKMLQDGIPYETVAKYAEVSVETVKGWEANIPE